MGLNNVIIAGGGVAGLSLACDLAMRGIEVTLIEKGSYPRHKVCGEYISLESKDYLERVCPEIISLTIPHISRFRLTASDNSVFDTHLPLGGFGISRYLLELLLYSRALSLGVNVVTEEKVISFAFSQEENNFFLTGKKGKYKAAVFCNATGKRSNLRAVNEPASSYIAVKYHIRIDRDEELIEIHNFPGGYCGISNIEDGKSCLCYIVNINKLKASGNTIQKLQKEYLFRNDQLREIFGKAKFLFNEPITISGISFNVKINDNDNVLYLGDSAGTISPVTGNGMSMALRSASVLAEEISKYINEQVSREHMLNAYRKFWKKEFESRVNLSSVLQTLTEYPLLTRMSIGLFNIFPSAANSLIAKTHGQPF